MVDDEIYYRNLLKGQSDTIDKLKEANNSLYEKIKKLKIQLEEHKQENKKLKEAINKAIEYVSNKKAIINTDVIRIFDLFEINEQGYTNELLDILKEVSE